MTNGTNTGREHNAKAKFVSGEQGQLMYVKKLSFLNRVYLRLHGFHVKWMYGIDELRKDGEWAIYPFGMSWQEFYI